MNPSTVQMVAAAIFALAVLHTFSTKFFDHLAHTQPKHAGVWHLLGEVEVVFGFWAFILVIAMASVEGAETAIQYVDTRNFTEPLFVFAIMVVAGSRAILQAASSAVNAIARILPFKGALGFFVVVLSLVPLMGSFITEPAAMTLAALMLRDRLFAQPVSTRLMYATLGVLFVNISIGGTLTSFAAPPVLMVASAWQWDTAYMLSHFGWKAAIAVAVNTAAVALIWSAELSKLQVGESESPSTHGPVPLWGVLVHGVFLAGIVVFAHHPAIFMGVFLMFLGFSVAYPHFQDRLILKEGLLVAFFLAGLVVLGGQQQWWLEPILKGMSADTVFWGATGLTAITDNAALTYLGSLVPGLSEEFKYALVAGAVTGGGLTVIANAPNPAGFSILQGRFADESIHPAGLLAAAAIPTMVAAMAFRLL